MTDIVYHMRDERIDFDEVATTTDDTFSRTCEALDSLEVYLGPLLGQVEAICLDSHGDDGSKQPEDDDNFVPELAEPECPPSSEKKPKANSRGAMSVAQRSTAARDCDRKLKVDLKATSVRHRIELSASSLTPRQSPGTKCSQSISLSPKQPEPSRALTARTVATIGSPQCEAATKAKSPVSTSPAIRSSIKSNPSLPKNLTLTSSEKSLKGPESPVNGANGSAAKVAVRPAVSCTAHSPSVNRLIARKEGDLPSSVSPAKTFLRKSTSVGQVLPPQSPTQLPLKSPIRAAFGLTKDTTYLNHSDGRAPPKRLSFISTPSTPKACVGDEERRRASESRVGQRAPPSTENTLGGLSPGEYEPSVWAADSPRPVAVGHRI